MIKPIILNIVAGVILIAMMATINDRYNSPVLVAEYVNYHMVLPNKLSIEKNKSVSLLELTVRNQSDDVKELNNLKIAGIRKYFDYSVTMHNSKLNSIDSNKAEFSQESDGVIYKFNNEIIIDKNGVVTFLVWGEISSNIFASVVSDNINYNFKEKTYVTGPDKYFSQYWGYFLVILMILLAISIYYYNESHYKINA